MKKWLFLLTLCCVWQLAAELLMWEDHQKKCNWFPADKKSKPVKTNGVLKTKSVSWVMGEQLMAATPDGANYKGTKLKFTVEAKGKGTVEIGIWNYQIGERQEWKKIRLTDEFKPYSVEHTLRKQTKYVRCIIRGEGEFRNAKLWNMQDTNYTIEAYPAYQLVSGTPEKVTFTLKKNGIPVKDAKLDIRNNEAFDPVSGAAAKAYTEQGDTAAFDAVAKKIKLDKPLNIAYLGDSLTHFSFGFNHADQAVYFLNKYNPRKAFLYNYAVRGDTCSQTLARLKGNYNDRFRQKFFDFKTRKYDIVLIFLGQNDSRTQSKNNYSAPFMTPARQKSNYRNMVKILRQNGAKRIIIISCASLDFPRMKAVADASAKAGKSHSLYGKPEFLELFNKTSQELAKELDL